MRRKKRILIVVASLTGGGAERVAVEWANTLSDFGHEVVVMSDVTKPISYRPNDEVKVLSFNLSRKPEKGGLKFLWWGVTSRIKVLIRMLRVMREMGTEVVIDVGHMYGLEVLVGTKLLGVKTIQTDHNACSRPRNMKMSRREYFRKFLQSRLFDAFTVLTDVDLKIMKQHGATNVSRLYNPLSFSEIEVCKNTRLRRVLAVGRLDAWRTKGIDILLHTWQNISRKHPDWKLRIVGDGAYIARGCVAKMYPECIKSIEFAPFTDKVGEEYNSAEVFVLPSRCEGWGLVALEAMAHGCATIVCDFEGRQREYVNDGVNGLLCKPDCASELENAIERVISDDGLRQRLQQNAPESVRRFAPKVVVADLEEIIYRVWGEGRRVL